MKFRHGVLFLLCFSMLIVPSVSAGVFGDDWDELKSFFGFGSYYSNKEHSSGYTLSFSNSVVLMAGEQECLYAGDNEEIEFNWFELGSVATDDNTVYGLIDSGDSHCFGNTRYPIRLYWEAYTSPSSSGSDDHKTRVYICDDGEWDSYGYFTEYYGNAIGGYWCEDEDDYGWIDRSGDFHCRESAVNSWCEDTSDVKDALACYEADGYVFSDCDSHDEYGMDYEVMFELTSGSNAGMYCCSVDFTNYYGGESTTEEDTGFWETIFGGEAISLSEVFADKDGDGNSDWSDVFADLDGDGEGSLLEGIEYLFVGDENTGGVFSGDGVIPIFGDDGLLSDIFGVDGVVDEVFSWIKWILLAAILFFLLPLILPTLIRWFNVIRGLF